MKRKLGICFQLILHCIRHKSERFGCLECHVKGLRSLLLIITVDCIKHVLEISLEILREASQSSLQIDNAVSIFQARGKRAND